MKVYDIATLEWETSRSTGLHGGLDSMAGRLLIELNPETNGCEHVLAVTGTRLMLVRIRGGVGRKLGPAIVPWWVHRGQIPAAQAFGEWGVGLGFPDASWIRLHGSDPKDIAALRARFPEAHGPWPGAK